MKAITVLITLWFILSVSRLGYKYLRAFTSEKNWIFMIDYQKKTRLLGDDFIFLSNIASSCSISSTVNIFNPFPKSDQKLFYLSYYYLYPRKLIFSPSNVLSYKCNE